MYNGRAAQNPLISHAINGSSSKPTSEHEKAKIEIGWRALLREIVLGFSVRE